MPILSAEATLFPESLFEATRPAGAAWWVFHTKPRQEKSLARHLHEKTGSTIYRDSVYMAEAARSLQLIEEQGTSTRSCGAASAGGAEGKREEANFIELGIL